MNTLESYLDTYENTFLPFGIEQSHEYFGYTTNSEYLEDLTFLLTNIYKNIKIAELSLKRSDQNNFRSELFNIYNECVISGNKCKDELEACHILELNNGGTYDVQNGLILERNLHSTFDKNYWTIDPSTLSIVIKENHSGTISNYKNVKANIKLTPITHMYLSKKYDIFINAIK